jgi:hypothetical protein
MAQTCHLASYALLGLSQNSGIQEKTALVAVTHPLRREYDSGKSPPRRVKKKPEGGLSRLVPT